MLLTRFACPHCDAVLKSPAGVQTGKSILCPKCKERFSVSAPAAGNQTSPQADEDESARVQTRRPSAGAPRPRQPQEDDEAMESEEEEAERPARKKRGKKGKRSTAPHLLIAALVGGAVLLVGGGIGLYFLLRKAPAPDLSAGASKPRTREPEIPKSNNEGKLVGKWQCTDAGGVIPPGLDMKAEFTAQSKFIMTIKGPGAEQAVTADYVLGQGDTVTFTNFSPPLPAGVMMAKDDITIKGDDMTMKEPDGRVMKFKRI